MRRIYVYNNHIQYKIYILDYDHNFESRYDIT